MKTVTITLRCPETVRAALMRAARAADKPLARYILDEALTSARLSATVPENPQPETGDRIITEVLVPGDDVPQWAPTWEQIKDKAHNYKTARIRATGEYVRIQDITEVPVVGVQEKCFLTTNQKGYTEHYYTDELCSFCL